MNLLIDAAIKKKEGFERLISAYASNGDTNSVLLKDKAKQELAAQERVVMDLVEAHIKLLKTIEAVYAADDSDPVTNSPILSR